MNRRGFLKGCMLFAGAATVPVFAKQPHGVKYGRKRRISDDDRARALALAMRRTKEQMAADIFNRAFG